MKLDFKQYIKKQEKGYSMAYEVKYYFEKLIS